LSRLAFIILFATATPVFASPAVPKTNPKPVYVHYMPWYETPATLGGNQWGWHWTMNNRNPNVIGPDGRRQIASHYYPSIGPYASSDPDVLEYHLLLMKLSGIDGVIMDWYGSQGSNGDIPSLLNNSNAMMNQVGRYGLKAGVMLEDRYARSIEDTKANVAYLRDHYFNNPSYIRTGAGNDPLMMIFGPITFQNPSQWAQIMSQAGEDVETLPLWYESNDLGTNADGEFAWIYQNATNHITHQQNFLANRSNTIGTAAGVAYPGFRDYYAEGNAGASVGFTIPHDNGATLAQTLGLNATYAANTQMVQLATWNDFGEGTMLEPTLEFGFTYLRQIQQFTGTPYGENELQMVADLYGARKRLAAEVPAQAQLDRAADALNNLSFPDAVDALRLADATSQIDRLFRQGGGPVNAGNVDLDFNGDGQIVPLMNAPASDVDYWVAVVNHTAFGDANLDGSVGFEDLLILARNFGQTSRFFGWTDGSFNGDGRVNFGDLLLLAQHYGFEDPSAFAMIRSLPEPGSLSALLALPVTRRRRA
jgi:hypothetical protein